MPAAPASICSPTVSTTAPFPFARNPKFSGSSSVACNILAIWNAPGVVVAEFEPSAGPVPPPKSVVIPLSSAA